MKSNLKKATMLLTGMLVGGRLLAQTADSTVTSQYVKPFSPESSFRTWSVGAGVGILTPYTIFGSNSRQDFTNPGSELGYSAFIKKQILPSFGLSVNYLGGKLSGDAPMAEPGTIPRSSFETKLNYLVSLNAEITLANINWRHQRGFIQPYLTVGGGFAGYKPVTTTAAGQTIAFKNGQTINEFVVPVGLGLKLNVADGVNIDLGYQVGFSNSDNLDGFTAGSTNDRFSYGHIGLEFALGKKSKPQLATHNPVASMRQEYLWENQNTRNQLQAQIDAEKAANAQLRNDMAATLAKFTADTDGDGVPDFLDKCPGTAAGVKVDGSGCPLPKPADVKVIVTEEDRKVVREAIQNLEFDFGKSTIRAKSYPSLNRVANLLVSKNFSLKLAGHTDNVGSDAANLKLSKDRAESIKSYLVSQGANASRIEATGYGESQPIASNKTAKGRQANRRVEFTLF